MISCMHACMREVSLLSVGLLDLADSFRSECGGQRRSDEVRPHFETVRAAASLPGAPIRTGPVDFERLELTVAFEGTDGTRSHVLAEALADDMRAWSETWVADCPLHRGSSA